MVLKMQMTLRIKLQNIYLSLFFFLRSTNSNGIAKSEQSEDSTAATKVMTLQLNGSTNTWSVSED